MAKETKSKKEPKLLKENSAKRLADSGTKKLKAGETKKIGVSAARAKKIKHTYQVKDAENALLLKLKDGDVVIEMYPEDAPEHVKRIKELARAEFYNGLKFHRVIDGFMAQTGLPLRQRNRRYRQKAESGVQPQSPQTRHGFYGALNDAGFRRQPVFHLLCRLSVVGRTIYRLGRGNKRHGCR